MKRNAGAVAAGVLALALWVSGCGNDTATVPTQAPAAQPTVNSADTDRTAAVKAALPANLAAVVKTATQTEPGRLQIGTSLMDPRGADGSPDAKKATAICEAAVAQFGDAHVSVMEDDGTSWILYGHPSYGNTCTEV